MIELRHLRTLLALRETGSLVEAAERVHLTQSALSHQLKDLESRVESPLFIRKTRPVEFTHQPEVAHEHREYHHDDRDGRREQRRQDGRADDGVPEARRPLDETAQKDDGEDGGDHCRGEATDGEGL